MHTVCQHVFWERLLPLWQALGVTDLHLSHCEPKSAAAAGAIRKRASALTQEQVEKLVSDAVGSARKHA